MNKKKPIKCDHCNENTGAKLSHWPDRLCDVCWRKFYGQPKKPTEDREDE